MTGKPKPVAVKGHSGYIYQLTPVTTEAYPNRPGRTIIKDLTDPNASSPAYYGHNVGRIFEMGTEFLHVEAVERHAYGSGEGDEIFGHNTYGAGHFVPAAKAQKLRAAWEAKAKVRSLELALKVARQDLDYGGRPEAVPGLEADLAEARRIASDIR